MKHKFSSILKILRLIFTSYIIFSQTLIADADNKIFKNIRVLQNILGRTLNISENGSFGGNVDITGSTKIGGSLTVGGNTVINGTLTVSGDINGGSVKTVLPVNTNQVVRFTDSTGKFIKGSSVLIDDSGNINVNNITLDGITKNGNTVAWPSGTGAVGTFIGSDGAGNLIYATPAGAGNVSSALNFVNTNAILKTDTASGSKNIQETTIILDNSNNISGLNSVISNSVSTNNLTITGGGNITGNLIGNVSGAVIGSLTGDVIGNVTGDVTGKASLNVLKAGDTMTGDLYMKNVGVNFQDSTVGGNYVGLHAPTTVASSYVVNLPSATPTAGQVMTISSGPSPFSTQWTTAGGGTPIATREIYVAQAPAGSDTTGNGTFSAPYESVSKALIQANGLATISNPVNIVVGAGTFTENNSGGALTITADGITISGDSISATIIQPNAIGNDLFSCSSSNVTFQNFSMQRTPGAGGSAISINTTGTGRIRFTSVALTSFTTGLNLNKISGTTPTVLMDNVQFTGCSTAIALNNMAAVIKNGVIIGPLLGGPANTGITISGIDCDAYVSDSTFISCANGATSTNSSSLHLLSCIFESSTNSVVSDGASKAEMVGCNFTLNTPTTINVQAIGAGTKVYVDSCLFDCEDSSGNEQGTCIKVTNAAKLIANNSTLDEAVIGIICGQVGDTSTTQFIASGLNISDCTTGIQQFGTSTLKITSGTFDENTISIFDPTNVKISSFDDDGNLAFGNTNDIRTPIYKISNGQPISPTLEYAPSYYGNKGTILLNSNTGANATPTAAAVQNDFESANYFVVTGDRTKQANINLFSDSTSAGLDFGQFDNVRGWTIGKIGTSADLIFSYTNSDSSGQLPRGQNTVMQLSGFDNTVQFPIATNAPTPTYSTARLIWAGDTNLYRSAANSLKTDDDFAANSLTGNNLTANRAVATDGTKKLVSSATTDTELGYLTGATSNVQTQLNSKLPSSGGTITGSLQITPGTLTLDPSAPGTPKLNFSDNLTTGLSESSGTLTLNTTGAPRLQIDSAGNVKINQFGLTAGIVHNLVSGNLGNSLIVNNDIDPIANITDTKLATITTAGKVANSATTATPVNTTGAIVSRDSNGDFAAGNITANLIGNVTGNLTGNVLGNVTGIATSAIMSTTATYLSGQLYGDVTGYQNATVVSYVGGLGGVSQAQIISGVNAANAAQSTASGDADKIVKRDGSGNFAVSGTITAPNFVATTAMSAPSFVGSLSGTAMNANTATCFSTSLSGDLSGGNNCTGSTVVSVGGQTAGNVAAATSLANAATDTNTLNAIVRRNNGNFSASTITANGSPYGFKGNLEGNVTGALYGNADTATFATFAANATGFTGPLAGDVTGQQNSTVVSFVGGKTASEVAIATDLALSATSGNIANTIVRRDGAGNFSTNMVTLDGQVTYNTDAATKGYVDTQVTLGGIVPKDPAIVFSPSQTSTAGLYTIDGVLLADGNRVLLNGQSTYPNDNGLWEAHASNWTRPTDFANGSTAGKAYVYIQQGTNFAGSSWICSTPAAIVGSADPIAFVQFSSPGSTTGQNVGSGDGDVFKDKTGIYLNFRRLLALSSYLTISTLSNDITFDLDATPNNTSNYIVARDSAGSFYGSMTGAASSNVLKIGDSMTGNLNMNPNAGTRSQINLKDSPGTGFVGIRASTPVSSSYTIDLPNAVPTAANQFLMATNTTTPISTTWTSISANPSANKTYYVSLSGNDTTGDGSYSFPYKTILKAVQMANLRSPTDITNPVVINVEAGVFIENNPASGIQISSDAVSIVGSSLASTIVVPQNPGNDLFQLQQPNVQLSNISLRTSPLYGPSTAKAVSMITTGTGFGEFTNITVIGFQEGFNASSSPLAPTTVFFDNVQLTDNGTCFTLANIQTSIKSCLLQGSSSGTPSGNGIITSGGATTLTSVISSILRFFNTAASVSGAGCVLGLSAVNMTANINSVICSLGSNSYINGLTSVINYPTSTNILAQDNNTIVSIEGSLFNGSLSGLSIGTGIVSSNGATINLSATSLKNLNSAIEAGTTGEITNSAITADGVTINGSQTTLTQKASSTLSFVSGTIDNPNYAFNDNTKVTIASFNSTNGTDSTLSFGSNIDTQQKIYQIQNGKPIAPTLEYEPNYYGSKGTIYKNSNTGVNSSPAFSGVFSKENVPGYFLVTGDRTKSVDLKLISDTATITGDGSNVRGWDITKSGTSADLCFTFTNNDTAGGYSVIGQNTAMQLDGFNNALKFPLATNSPTPTYSTARLIWAPGVDTNTNLYRSTTDTLKTDGNFISAGNLTANGDLIANSFTGNNLTGNRAVVTDGTKKLISSATTDTQIGYLSNVTSDVQNQINSKLSSTGGTISGALTVSPGPLTLDPSSPGTPKLNFSDSTNTGISENTGTLTLNTAGAARLQINSSGTVTINQFGATGGLVHNSAPGILTNSLLANADIPDNTITDIKLQTITTAGKVANTATTATDLNTPNTIVLRNGSNSFTAGVVTATGGFIGDLTGDVTGNLNGQATSSITSTTSTYFTGTLSGDVTGNQYATVVSKVQGANPTGVTADEIIAGVSAANAATDAPTNGTIVLRNSSSGNFSTSGDVTANRFIGSLSGVAQSAIYASGAGSAVSFSGPLSGDVIGNQSLTVVNTVAGISASGPSNSIYSGVTLANNSSNLYGSGTIVRRDASGNFIAGTITATLNGTASGNVLITGDTMSGPLAINYGSASSTSPSISFGTTGAGIYSAGTADLHLETSGINRINIDAAGAISIPTLNTAYGVIKNDVSGNLTSELIDNNNIANAAGIVDTKLSTISTPGKVSNSATTATETNTPDTIVLRDASRNFSAGTITANTFSGNLNGVASGNLPTSGGTLSGTLKLPAGYATGSTGPSLQFTDSTNTGLSAQTANTLVFSTNNGQRMSISPAGTVAINSLSPSGVVHNDNAGNLSSSLIVDGDITVNSIANNKLATITSSNTANYIVVRDASGNFAANVISATGIILQQGSAANPALSFTSNTNTGIYSPATNNVSISAGGAEIERIMTTGAALQTGQFSVPVGTNSAPSYTFNGDTNTGLYRSATDTTSFTAGGTGPIMSFSPTLITQFYPLAVQAPGVQLVSGSGAVTVANSTSMLILNNTTVASITMPSAPVNGQILTITLASAANTNLSVGSIPGTVAGNNWVDQLGANAFTTAGANVRGGRSVTYMYLTSGGPTPNAWYRIGRG